MTKFIGRWVHLVRSDGRHAFDLFFDGRESHAAYMTSAGPGWMGWLWALPFGGEPHSQPTIDECADDAERFFSKHDERRRGPIDRSAFFAVPGYEPRPFTWRRSGSLWSLDDVHGDRMGCVVLYDGLRIHAEIGSKVIADYEGDYHEADVEGCIGGVENGLIVLGKAKPGQFDRSALW